MTDYVFYPVTGDGESTDPYTWNLGTANYSNGADWAAVPSFETLTIGGTVTSGTVPPNGSNVGLIAGVIDPSVFAFYQANPAEGDPYIAASTFPVDVLLNTGAVTLGNLLLAGFNEFASILEENPEQFPTLDVEGAKLSITGDILDSATVTFPPIDTGFFGTYSSAEATGGGTIDIGQGGTVDVSGTVPDDIAFNFNDGKSNLLEIGGDSTTTPAAFNGVITGYTSGDTILLPNIPATDDGVATTGTYDVATGVLTITVGDPVNVNLDVPGFMNTSGSIDIVANGNGIEVVPCFLKGTHISTAGGEIPVEQLAVGDLARTAGGALKPVVWIGSGQALATRGRRDAATPVIVRRGALSDNVPSRDLRITKGHSLYIDGVLIPAEYLINHRSILWDDTAQEVTVYHVELAEHEVLIAEGAHAESYRDDGNRWLFRNANSSWDFPPKPACAPVLTGGPIVDAIWRRVLNRAGPRPGIPTTDEPDLHIVIDGKRVDAVSNAEGCYLFRLPACPDTARLVSRTGVPEELGVARDPRSLGVAIRGVTAWRGSTFATMDASDPALTDGFHAFETDTGLRWTDGNALLPPTLFARLHGAIQIELRVCGTTTYRLEGDGRERVAA
jgi:Hint domain